MADSTLDLAAYLRLSYIVRFWLPGQEIQRQHHHQQQLSSAVAAEGGRYCRSWVWPEIAKESKQSRDHRGSDGDGDRTVQLICSTSLVCNVAEMLSKSSMPREARPSRSLPNAVMMRKRRSRHPWYPSYAI